MSRDIRSSLWRAALGPTLSQPLRRAVLAAMVVAVLFSDGRLARASDARAANIEVSLIHAVRTDGGGSIDPKLRDLPQLTKQEPFVRYNVFKLLDRKVLECETSKTVAYDLVDGRTLQATLVDVKGQKSEARYHLRAEIAGPGKKEFLKLLEVTASAGEPFFVGGQSYKGGTLFLELVVRS